MVSSIKLVDVCLRRGFVNYANSFKTIDKENVRDQRTGPGQN